MPSRHTEFPSSDFAITSVNVGDRLDQREIDDRKQQDEWSFYASRRWGSVLRTWARRLLPYIVLIVLVGLAGEWLSSERDKLAADRIAQRVTASLHVPVRVQDSRFRTSPAPALVMTGVDLGGRVRLNEVTLEFTAPSLWQAVITGRRRWGDILISPTTLTFGQANQLLDWLSALDSVVPDSVTKVRIPEVRFAGSGLLPDRYEAVTRRETNGKFATVTLRRLGTNGTMQLQLTPDVSAGSVSFECDATGWQPPFAPHADWSEMVASGHTSAGTIELDKFTLGSTFGAIEGHLSVRRQVNGPAAWSAEGQISSVGIDIPTIVQQITKSEQPIGGGVQKPGANPGQSAGDTDQKQTKSEQVLEETDQNQSTPIAGTAAIEGTIAGMGATPEEALSHLVAAGDIKVRNAALNGINLGYAASRPSAGTPSSNALTRFTQLSASFITTPAGLLFRNIHGAAGALSARGEVVVSPELALDGLLHVDLGTTRIQAPLRIHVRGDVAHPKYGR